ncbi:hypothetical protein ACIODX_32380 [Streptomyces sp. NPDC088190]|uniref:hypothetical protein n=1 Tax=unclassified Streptomyces TaxID=2593676 RepID=UPI0033E5595B
MNGDDDEGLTGIRRGLHILGHPLVNWMVRVVGILVILMGAVSAAAAVFPEKSGMADFLSDARGGRMSSVHVMYVSPVEARARWGDGFVGSKEYTYRFESLPEGRDSGEAFGRVLRERLEGEGADLVFDDKDPLAGLGGLSTLIPLLYWRFIEVAWLKWAVMAVFAAGLGAMVTRKMERTPSAGYWLAAACVGSGVLAYFWTEPHSLRQPSGSRVCNSVISGWGVFVRSVCWFGMALLVVLSVMSLR